MTSMLLGFAAFVGLWLWPEPATLQRPARLAPQIVRTTTDQRPLRLVLLIDVTTRPPMSEAAVRGTVEQVIGTLSAQDRASVWRVGGGIVPGPAFTRDARVLRDAARRAIRPEAADRSGPSPIWDALVLAVGALRQEEGRRVVLLVTDGRATGNRHGLAEAIGRASAAGVMVHVVAPESLETFFSGLRLVTIHPDRALEALAANTGGTFARYSEEQAPVVGTLVGRVLRGDPIQHAVSEPAKPQPPPASQLPTIRSGVELVRVDVQVTGRDGLPSLDLGADDFEVRIDGELRPVRTVEFVRSPDAAAAASPPGATRPRNAVNASREEGRTLILAIDQASLVIATEPAAVEVVRRIAAMAHPNDAIGLVAYPAPGVSVAPTRDRQALLDAASKIGGQLHLPRGRVYLSIAEAVDWGTDAEFRRQLVRRLCPSGDQACGVEVEMAATEIVNTLQMQAVRGVSGLHGVIDAAREYPGRKALVIVSAGFPASDRIGGRPDVRSEADRLGKRAAAANVVLYSLHLDVSFLYAFSAASAGKELQTVFRNSQMLASGLEQFTASGGGTLITVHAGPDAALERLLTETSAYYLVGVEPLPEHRDGEVHRIQVKVNERGAVVRSRTSVLIPAPPGR